MSFSLYAHAVVKLLTVEVLHDLLEALVLADLRNNFLDAICTNIRQQVRLVKGTNLLNITPIKVKMTNCEMTRKAK